jgi:type II secretion system protein J
MIKANNKMKTTPPLSSCPVVSGFTLIEVLVSLALLTIVLGAIYSSFFSVQNALERFDSVSLKYHEARTALDIMRREIESAILKVAQSEERPLTGTDFIIKDRDVFGKSASSLVLTAYTSSGQFERISYGIKQNEGRLDLLKKQSPHMMPANIYTLQLIEGVKSFSVETLFNNIWVKTWDSHNTDKLPEVVRITVEFDDNGKNIKLTEYAKPRVGRKL